MDGFNEEREKIGGIYENEKRECYLICRKGVVMWKGGGEGFIEGVVMGLCGFKSEENKIIEWGIGMGWKMLFVGGGVGYWFLGVGIRDDGD